LHDPAAPCCGGPRHACSYRGHVCRVSRIANFRPPSLIEAHPGARTAMRGDSNSLNMVVLYRRTAPGSPKSAPKRSCLHRPSAWESSTHQAAPCSRPSSRRSVAGGSTTARERMGSYNSKATPKRSGSGQSRSHRPNSFSQAVQPTTHLKRFKGIPSSQGGGWWCGHHRAARARRPVGSLDRRRPNSGIARWHTDCPQSPFRQ
jgi:hypothetical protein